MLEPFPLLGHVGDTTPLLVPQLRMRGSKKQYRLCRHGWHMDSLLLKQVNVNQILYYLTNELNYINCRVIKKTLKM